MNMIPHNFRKLALVISAALVLTACASSPRAPDGADVVRGKLTSLQANSQLATLAPIEIQDAEQAVRAGVAAYIVDGLAPGRVRSILDVAMSRFALMQQLRGDLAKVKADLESRKTVDRAKGLLMKERGLDEDAAYRLLRKLAMDKGRPIGAIAADLLAFAGILKGDAS